LRYQLPTAVVQAAGSTTESADYDVRGDASTQEKEQILRARRNTTEFWKKMVEVMESCFIIPAFTHALQALPVVLTASSSGLTVNYLSQVEIAKSHMRLELEV
jgi:hypothetical protein